MLDPWLCLERAADGDYFWVSVVRTRDEREVDDCVAVFLGWTAAAVLEAVSDRIDKAVASDAEYSKSKVRQRMQGDGHGADRSTDCCGLREVALGDPGLERPPARTTLEIPLRDLIGMGLSVLV